MQSRAPAQPTVREFEATVQRVDGRDVVLDETFFYAESGGQPADRGVLADRQVVDVQSRDDDVVHTLAAAPDVTAGDTVVGVVDADFRTYCMRAHTASHALYGAGRRLLDDLGYGGFNIDAEKVRVDFSTTTDIDDAMLVELERLTNRAVWESRPVSWEDVPVDEAHARDDVAFNTKTEEGVMADADTVRLVTIGADGDDDPWDVAACGGTHVSNTREIGPIEVLDRSNPGEGLTRVEFAVGPSGVDHRAAVHRTARRAARELDAPLTDLGDAAVTLRQQKADLADELASVKADLLEYRLQDLSAVERDGRTWRVGVVDGVGPNDVGDRLQSLAGEAGDVLVVAGDSGNTFVVVASTGDVAAGGVVDEVTDAFGGGGGGGETFAQGGGLSATPEDVVAFLTE